MKRQTVFDNWAGGVVTTMRPDALPAASSPRGRNSLLAFLAGGEAVASKRPGFEILNSTSITGKPSVIGQIEFNRHNGGALVTSHVLVSNNGTLNKLVSGTVSPLDAGSPTPFTTGDLFPVFAVLNDMLFIVNGTDKKKVTSAAVVQNFGITRPAAGPTVTDAGVGGTPNGTYDFAISYFNSAANNESSRSDFNSVTVTSHKINVAWTAPTDPQIDYVFVYIRKQSIMSQFFKLIVGTTPSSATNGGFPIVTTSVVVDVADATLTALTLLAPDTAENNPPPTGLVATAAHLNRLFVADTGYIYWSKPRQPEQFDPNAKSPVNPNDGQNIVAIGSFFERLIIWKSGSIYALNGSDENSWYVGVVDSEIGAASAQSIKYHEGYLYWWSKFGPVRWNGANAPEKIGVDLIAPTIAKDQLNYDQFFRAATEIDTNTNTVLFAIPENGQQRNTLVLPWHTKGATWSSDGWNIFDIASMAIVRDGNGTPWVVAGNYAGRAFRFGTNNPDGARTADDSGNTLTLSGAVTSATSTTVSDALATFDTKGDGLADLYVYAIATDGTTQRRRIVSNTATQITVVTAWDATPDTTYTYAIAAPWFQWDTKWTDDGEPFHSKRSTYCFSQVLSDSGNAAIKVQLLRDYDSYTPIDSVNFQASGTGGIWDVSLFDDGIFGEIGITYNRSAIRQRFRAYRLRYSNIEPNSQVALVRASLEVILLSEKTSY